MAEDKWEIYQDHKNEWRWRRIAANGNIVGASTEGYNEQADCEANANHYGFKGEFKPAGKWEFYQDHANEWRWRHTADNGKIIGGSSEGYNNKSDCVANAKQHGCTDEA